MARSPETAQAKAKRLRRKMLQVFICHNMYTRRAFNVHLSSLIRAEREAAAELAIEFVRTKLATNDKKRIAWFESDLEDAILNKRRRT